MSERDEINVVNDQIGNPTYAKDLAEAILQIITQLNSNPKIQYQNIYHYTNTGNISWYQFAKAIQEFLMLDCKVNPIPSSSFPTPAKRSHYSVLDCSAIENDFGIAIKNWKESLNICLTKLST